MHLIENYYQRLYEEKYQSPEQYKEQIKRKVVNENSEDIPERKEEILSTLENKLEFIQPIEQAGFRKKFSTCDHLLTIRTLNEKLHNTAESNIGTSKS